MVASVDGTLLRPSSSGGRVQVFARVRPSGHKGGGDLGTCIDVDSSCVVRVRNDSDAVERVLQGQAADSAIQSVQAREFTFDGSFQPGVTQREVFTHVGMPVLRECLKGFNGTILAYGQTGSGKTHSLLHQGARAEDIGLLPRVVASLFVLIAQDSTSVYTIDAAAMQVYNEQVDDLLHPDHKSGGGQGLAVQNGGDVPGLSWTTCSRPDTLLDIFSRARTNLIYAETKMNKASSRSHAVFQMRITRRQRATAVGAGSSAVRMACTHARLSVVDLSGSERVKRSGVEGTQFKEATCINKSLLAFGNVVSALAGKRPHVPFRDSKLTRILEGSIGGNCKTSLLVCVSPDAENVHETLSSLEFASRAMRVEVNARINEGTVEVDSKALLADLNEDLGDLGMNLGPELTALRKASLEAAQAAQRAEQEAQLRERAVSEKEAEAKRLHQAAEEARRRLTEAERAREEERKSLRLAAEEANQKLALTQQGHRDETRALKEAAADASRQLHDLRTATEKRLAEQTLAAEAAAAELNRLRTAAEKHAAQLKRARASEESASEANRQLRDLRFTLERQGTQLQEARTAEAVAARRADELHQHCQVAAEDAKVAGMRVHEAEATLEQWQARANEAEKVLKDLQVELSERAAKAAEALAEECRRTDAISEEAATLRKNWKEATDHAAALESELSSRTFELHRRSTALDEASAALESLKVEADAREQRLHEQHASEMEAVESKHEAAIEAVRSAAQQVLEEERTAHIEEVTGLETQLRMEAASHATQVAELQAEHAAAVEAQRANFEARLQTGRAEFEERLVDLQVQAEQERHEFHKQLEGLRSQLQENESSWKDRHEEAVRQAWEHGNVQQRRLAAAFKAARCVSAEKESQVRAAHDELAHRFANRESRQEDLECIASQQRGLFEQHKLLRDREHRMEDLSRELVNRDATDRIFGPQSRRTHNRSESARGLRPPVPSGAAPPLPGKKLGELSQSFRERQRRSTSLHRPVSPDLCSTVLVR